MKNKGAILVIALLFHSMMALFLMSSYLLTYHLMKEHQAYMQYLKSELKRGKISSGAKSLPDE